MSIRRFIFLIVLGLLLSTCTIDQPVPDSDGFTLPQVDELVMYEVNLRAFGPSHDFAAVEGRLGDIRNLQVNAIWLMPVYPVGTINSVGQLGSPYAVADYTAVNPEFGTTADFENLVQATHEKGMAVVLDWVANHTAWDNPWLNNPDWYTQDADGNIVSPPGTNWNDVADLNFENTEMRLAMIDAMWYWIEEFDIDGFRCDAADMVPFDFWKQAIDSLRSRSEKPLLMLAEGNRTDHFTAGFQLNYGWEFYGTLKNVMNNNAPVSDLEAAHLNETNTLPPGTARLRFTTNHDETAWDQPPPALFGSQEAAFTAWVITVTMGGVPLIYSGQETGVSVNTPFFSQSTIDWTANPDILLKYVDFMQLYANHPALLSGTLIWKESGYHILMYERETGNDRLICMINPRSTAFTRDVPIEWQGSWFDAVNGNHVTLSESIELAPYEYIVLTNSFQ